MLAVNCQKHLLDVDYFVADVLQNLGVLNLDELLPFQDVAPRLDVEVDAELRLQLKMDCYLDAVDVAPH